MTGRRVGFRLLAPLCLAAAALSITACSSTATPRPRPAAMGPSVSPDQALASYREDLESGETRKAYATEEEVDVARHRTEAVLGSQAIDDFGLFIYINKQASGPMAQRAFLFEKDMMGDLKPLDTWLVTTAREQHEVSPKGEKKFTTTPPGIYQFDPNMFVRLHKSNAWEADMPYAMFLKSRTGGPTEGYALHAALEKYVHNLGQRASAGCIRLLPENAEKLFKVLKRDYAGPVPKTSSTAGLDLTVNEAQRIPGIQALVIIDDTPGRDLIARYGQGSVAAAPSHASGY